MTMSKKEPTMGSLGMPKFSRKELFELVLACRQQAKTLDLRAAEVPNHTAAKGLRSEAAFVLNLADKISAVMDVMPA